MKYKIKIESGLELGPYEKTQVIELINEGKLNENAQIMDFPFGEWEIIKFSDFDESEKQKQEKTVNKEFKEDLSSVMESNDHRELNPDQSVGDFQEFSFDKKQHSFEVGKNDKQKETERAEDSEKVKSSSDTVNEPVDKTVVLKTKQFKAIDSTKVVKIENVEMGPSSLVSNEEGEGDEVSEAESELVPEVSSEDKTMAISRDKLDLRGALEEAAETSLDFKKAIDEENQQQEKADDELGGTDGEEGQEVAEDKLEGGLPQEKRKKIIIVLMILAGVYFFIPEEQEKVGFLKPRSISVIFPVPDDTADEIKSQEYFRKGKVEYSKFRKNSNFNSLNNGIKFFKASLEKNFRNQVVYKLDGKEAKKNVINESIDYLILLGSFSLEYADDELYAGESFHRLITLVESKKYTSVIIAEATARYYAYFNKMNAAKGTIENYLRISKKPSLELFSIYLKVLVNLGDFVKAKELLGTLSNQKFLPIEGYLAISRYYEYNEEPKKEFETIQRGIKVHPASSKLLLRAIEFLIRERRLEEIKPLIKLVKKANAGFSKVLVSKYYETLGMYYASLENYTKAVSSFKYALKIHKNVDLQAKLSALEIGGTDIVEALILESKIQILINKSKEFLKRGNLDNALRLAVEASDLSDSNIASKVYLSEIQLRKGLFNSAISMLEKYSKINNGDLQIEAALVRAYILSFKTDEAFKRLRMLSSSDFGNSSEYQFLLGLLYEKEGDLYKASKAFEISVQINPLDDQAFKKLGDIYLKARRYKFAKERLNKAIQLNPNNANYVASYAQVLYELNGPDMAIGFLRDHFNSFPKSAVLYSKIAQFYYNSGLQKDYERYRDLLFNETDFEPSFYEFLINESRREGKTDLIIKYSKKYLQFDGSNLSILFNLGRHYLSTNDAKNAETIFTELKDKLKTYPLVNYYLAKVYIELRDFEKAKEFGKLEKSLNPNKSNGDSILGLIFKIKEDYPKAIKSYERAISLNSKDSEALLELGWIRAKQLEFSRAKDLVTTAKSVDPGNARVYKELGYIYKGLGQSALAIQYFETYLKMNALGKDKALIESEINKLKF